MITGKRYKRLAREHEKSIRNMMVKVLPITRTKRTTNADTARMYVGKITEDLNNGKFKGNILTQSMKEIDIVGHWYTGIEVICQVAELGNVEVGARFSAFRHGKFWLCTGIYEGIAESSDWIGWSSEGRFSSNQAWSSDDVHLSSDVLLSTHDMISSQDFDSDIKLSSHELISSGEIISSHGTLSSGDLLSSDDLLSSGQLISSDQKISSDMLISSGEKISSDMLISSGELLSSDDLLSSGQLISSDEKLSSQDDDGVSSDMPSSDELGGGSSDSPSSDAPSSGLGSSDSPSSDAPSSGLGSSGAPSSDTVSSDAWYECDTSSLTVAISGIVRCGTDGVPSIDVEAKFNGVHTLTYNSASGNKCYYGLDLGNGCSISITTSPDSGDIICQTPDGWGFEHGYSESGDIHRGGSYANENTCGASTSYGKGSGGTCHIF